MSLHKPNLDVKAPFPITGRQARLFDGERVWVRTTNGGAMASTFSGWWGGAYHFTDTRGNAWFVETARLHTMELATARTALEDALDALLGTLGADAHHAEAHAALEAAQATSMPTPAAQPPTVSNAQWEAALDILRAV